MRYLYLDDVRDPRDSGAFMHTTIYGSKHWHIVRNYEEFVMYLRTNGMPDVVSFDHDLNQGHYHRNVDEWGNIDYASEDFAEPVNKTGYHCAQYMVDMCIRNQIRLPNYLVHSMNPVGKKNIHKLLEYNRDYILKNAKTLPLNFSSVV